MADVADVVGVADIADEVDLVADVRATELLQQRYALSTATAALIDCTSPKRGTELAQLTQGQRCGLHQRRVGARCLRGTGDCLITTVSTAAVLLVSTSLQ